MGKNKKERKKIVGSAAVGAARGESEDGASAEFAVEGMGLQAPSPEADGSSAEEIPSSETYGPPACSVLDDVTSQPAEVDHSEGVPSGGGEPASAGLTLDQQGEATREAFLRDARLN